MKRQCQWAVFQKRYKQYLKLGESGSKKENTEKYSELVNGLYKHSSTCSKALIVLLIFIQIFNCNSFFFSKLYFVDNRMCNKFAYNCSHALVLLFIQVGLFTYRAARLIRCRLNIQRKNTGVQNLEITRDLNNYHIYGHVRSGWSLWQCQLRVITQI